MSGVGFVLFLQEAEFFDPVYRDVSLADGLAARLNQRQVDVSSLTVFTVPGLKERVESLMKRCGSGTTPAPSIRVVDTPILRNSFPFFEAVHSVLRQNPAGDVVFLEPQSTAFDWEVVRSAVKILNENDGSHMAYSIFVGGWDIQAVKPAFGQFIESHRAILEKSPAPFTEVVTRFPEIVAKISPASDAALSKKMWEPGAWEKRIAFFIDPVTLSIYRELFKRTQRGPADLSLFEFGKHVGQHMDLIDAVPDSIVLEISADSSVIPFYSPLHHMGDRIRARGKWMPTDLFDLVLSKIEPALHHRLKINFSGMGDPFDHPDAAALIDSMYRRFSARGRFPHELVYYTYGGNLTAAISELLVRHQYPGCANNLLIRLDTDDEQLYSKLRAGVPLAAVLNNIRGYFDIKRQFYRSRNLGMRDIGPKTAVLITLVAEVVDRIDDFMNRWPALVPYMKKRVPKGTPRKEILEFQDKFYKDHPPLEYVVIVSPSHFAHQIPDLHVADYTPLKRFPCRRLMSALTILCDGTIVPCDRVVVPENGTRIGHIRDFDSILDVWNHPPLKRWRDEHRETRFDGLPLCRNCGDWFIPVD